MRLKKIVSSLQVDLWNKYPMSAASNDDVDDDDQCRPLDTISALPVPTPLNANAKMEYRRMGIGKKKKQEERQCATMNGKDRRPKAPHKLLASVPPTPIRPFNNEAVHLCICLSMTPILISRKRRKRIRIYKGEKN